MPSAITTMSDPTTVQTTTPSEHPAQSVAPEVAAPSKPVLETSNAAPQSDSALETKETPKPDTVEGISTTDTAAQDNMAPANTTSAEAEKKKEAVSTIATVDEDWTTKVPDGDKEPQNTLTERFTRAEWEALKKFRVCCPFLNSVTFRLTRFAGGTS